MRSFCIVSFLFFGNLLYTQELSTSLNCKSISEDEARYWLLKNSASSNAALNNYTIFHQRCTWEIDPAMNFISGNILTRFKPTVNNFNELQFDMAIDLKVDSILYHSATLSYTHQTNEVLRIALPSLISENTPDSVCVYYHGIPSGNGFGSFVQTSHNGVPIVWTLSEPFGSKTWWPCKQNLADKIDSLDIIVTTPQGNRVASNGLLIAEDLTGNSKRYHWKTRYPIATYLVAIAVTNYTAYSDMVPLKSKTLQVLNYVYPENLSSSKVSTAKIIDIIHLFDSLLIEYPFANEKYGHAEFSWGGGMEHQTMSFMGGFGLSLMAHECAHQWFGDYITTGSWEDIWLNEGFATFFEWMVTERYDPSGWNNGLEALVKGITSQPGGSVLCDDTNSVSRIFDSRLSYSKGAFLLRMLHWKIGEDAFYTSLKSYLNDPSLKNNYARTPQLITHCEESSGQDLETFFAQWYYGQGYPSYHLNWRQTESVLTFTLDQQQSHPSVAFFDMPLPVQLYGKERDTTLIINATQSGEQFSFEIDFRVEKIRIDPDYLVLSANNSVIGFNNEDLKEAQIVLFPNPVENIFAISGLPQGLLLNKITYTNILGQTVYTNYTKQLITAELELYAELLSRGVYIVSLYTELGVVHRRFTKL